MCGSRRRYDNMHDGPAGTLASYSGRPFLTGWGIQLEWDEQGQITGQIAAMNGIRSIFTTCDISNAR